MSKVIVYRQDNGVVAVIRPMPEALDKFGIQAIAEKDVPHGKRFAIVDESLVPTDRSQRNAWTVNDKDLTSGVGSESNSFSVPEESSGGN